jgi:hypothetical protein
MLVIPGLVVNIIGSAYVITWRERESSICLALLWIMHLNFNLKLKQQSLAPLCHVQLLTEWVYSRADLAVKYIYGIYNRTTYLSSIQTGEIGRQIISQSCKHTITYRYKYTWEGIEPVRNQSHVRYHIRRDSKVVRTRFSTQFYQTTQNYSHQVGQIRKPQKQLQRPRPRQGKSQLTPNLLQRPPKQQHYAATATVAKSVCKPHLHFCVNWRKWGAMVVVVVMMKLTMSVEMVEGAS